jgi:hypothetical protein
MRRAGLRRTLPSYQSYSARIDAEPLDITAVERHPQRARCGKNENAKAKPTNKMMPAARNRISAAGSIIWFRTNIGISRDHGCLYQLKSKELVKSRARGQRGEAGGVFDKVALSGAMPFCKCKSSTLKCDFFYPFRGGSVGVSLQQSLPTLRHLHPKFPIIVVLSVRGEVSTFIDLRLEKICFVEHCYNQKAPLRGPSVTKRLCAVNCSRNLKRSYLSRGAKDRGEHR